MSALGVSVGKFFAGWTPLALAAAAVDPAPRLADLFAFTVDGVTIPPVTCLLGAIGVLGARPFARRGESELSTGLFVLMSLIMLVAVEVWVIERQPSALFAFTIAIGLGFSGYSLIEQVGEELKAVALDKVRAIARLLGVQAHDGKGPNDVQ